MPSPARALMTIPPLLPGSLFACCPALVHLRRQITRSCSSHSCIIRGFPTERHRQSGSVPTQRGCGARSLPVAASLTPILVASRMVSRHSKSVIGINACSWLWTQTQHRPAYHAKSAHDAAQGTRSVHTQSAQRSQRGLLCAQPAPYTPGETDDAALARHRADRLPSTRPEITPTSIALPDFDFAMPAQSLPPRPRYH